MKLLVLTFCLFVLHCRAADILSNGNPTKFEPNAVIIREPSAENLTIENRNLLDDTLNLFKQTPIRLWDFFFKDTGSQDLQRNEEYWPLRLTKKKPASNETVENSGWLDRIWNYVKKRTAEFWNCFFKRSESPDIQMNESKEVFRKRITRETPASSDTELANHSWLGGIWNSVKRRVIGFWNFFFKYSGSRDIQTDEAEDTGITRKMVAKNETVENRDLVNDTHAHVKEEATKSENSLVKRSASLNEQEEIGEGGDINTRIIGGTTARESQFPYQALLSYGDKPYCAASIIHERWALTARHCILENQADIAYITVGTIRLDKVGGVSIAVDQFIPHTGYDFKTKEENNGLAYVINDIGLIHLKQPIQFTNKASPIPLPSSELPNLGGKIGVVAGWGYTEKVKNAADLLQTAHVRLLDRKTCQKYWTYVRDLHLCTSIVEPKSICFGDSGGALVVDGRQYGVISTIEDDCGRSKPNLYVDVSGYVRWIQAEMERFGDYLPFRNL